MAEGRVKNTELSAIAAAIRSKNGSSTAYKPSEMAAAIAAIPTGTTPTGTVNITQNGTTDVTQYASAAVNVPNSYAAGDEGKVVSNGALVAQTARSATITQNGTYDTTNNNEVTVNVSGGGGGANADPIALILDNEDNSSRTYTLPYVSFSNSQSYSYVFMFADNQTTNITIGGNTHSGSEQWAWSAGDDNTMIFSGKTDSLSIRLSRGDSGNHACTLLLLNDQFTHSYDGVLHGSKSVSVTVDSYLAAGYVLFLFSVYEGSTSVKIRFMGETVTVKRYADRYGNSIYYHAAKLENVAANTVVTASVTATASKVIGIMGVFGN